MESKPADIILTGGAVVTMDFPLLPLRSGGQSPSGAATSWRWGRPSGWRGRCRLIRWSTAAAGPSSPAWSTPTPTPPMTLLRGLADDLRLDVWLMGYMMPVEREFVDPGILLAGHAAGLRRDDPLSGVTCFDDMYYYEEAVADATAQVGMRALCAPVDSQVSHARRDQLR